MITMTPDSPSTDKRRIGGFEVRVSPEYLTKLRVRAKELKTPDRSWTQVAKDIAAEMPDANPRTTVDHVLVAARTSDYVFSLYVTEKISYLVYCELATWRTKEDKDEIAKTEILKYKMTHLQVIRFKKAMGDVRNSIDTVRSIALGVVPKAHRLERARKSVRDFATIVDEIEELSMQLLSRLDQVDDLIPGTVLDNGEVRSRLNKVAWDLRHATKITFDYIDARVRKFKKEIQSINMKETNLAIEQQEGEKDGRRNS